MENLQWRSKAKFVAWMHITITALILVLLFAGTAIVTVSANQAKNVLKSHSSPGKFPHGNGNKPQLDYNDVLEALKTAIMVIWIRVGIYVILSAIEIWGVVMLLNATKTTTGASDCNRKCKNYISITSFIIAVSDIIGTIFFEDRSTLVGGIIGTILRAGFIFVAYKLRQEVKPYALTQTYRMEQTPCN